MDLVEAARKAGVRGVDIATTFRVAPSTVNRWLHRDCPVPPHHIRRFASILKIPVEAVLPLESDTDANTESESTTIK